MRVCNIRIILEELNIEHTIPLGKLLNYSKRNKEIIVDILNKYNIEIKKTVQNCSVFEEKDANKIDRLQEFEARIAKFNKDRDWDQFYSLLI